MKAEYLDDNSVNIKTAPDDWRDKCKPVFKGGKVVDWIIPKGTVIEGEEALLRVRTGQAKPADDECAKACGMSSAELAVTQRLNLAAARGIQGEHDLQLFMAGVIDGYDMTDPKHSNEKPSYIPGARWEEFQKEKAKSEKGGAI